MMRRSLKHWLYATLLMSFGLLVMGCSSSAPSGAAAPDSRFNAVPTSIPATSVPQDTTASSQVVVAKRVIIRNANLDITAADPSAALDKILALADTYGGWVVNSNLSQRTGANNTKQSSATVEIRVLYEKLDAVVAEIKALAASVSTFKVTGQDVTDQYVDLSSQLTNLQATEARLQKIMDNATTTTDVLAINRELTTIRGQIEQIQGKLKFYDQSAAYSSVMVYIAPVSSAPQVEVGSWQPGKTVTDAISVLIASARFVIDLLIWLIIVGGPILIVVGIVALVARWLLKRFAPMPQSEVPPGQ